MRTRRWQLALVAVTITAVTACDGADGGAPRGWQGTVDTLANGARHVQNPAEGTWTDEAAWRVEQDLVIGSVDGEGPETFGMIADLEVDAAGRIYVLEAMAKEVRVFGPGGEHVRSFGRTGDGPGEFRNPSALLWLPDGGLVVVDLGGGRYSVFDTAGTFVTQGRRDLPRSFFPWRGGIDTAGRIVDWITAFDQATSQSANLLVRRALLPADTAPATADTFHLALPEIEQLEMTIPGGVSRTPVPFGARLGWFIDGPREAFWTTSMQDYRLVSTGFAGDTLLVIDKADTPVPVTDEERQQAIARLQQSGWTPEPGRIPDQKPAVRAFVIDELGFLWVAPTSAPNAFDVFDPGGFYLGAVPVPPGLAAAAGRPLRIRRNALYAVAADSLGVESVIRLRLARGPG